MRKSIKKMVDEFRQFWRHYVLQSILSTLSVFIVLYFLSLHHAVIIASIGAIAFIVFAMPDNITAQARNVIGGHLVGLFYGFLFSLIPQPALIYSIMVYSLAVGATIFTMVVNRYGTSTCGRYRSRSCNDWYIFRCIYCG